MNNISGRRWARFALIFGAAMSILGNETDTVLTSSSLNIIIRVALAFIWPAALFVAVEVLVRVNWRQRFIDYAGRVIMMIPVSMVAAVVSYRHLHALMLIADPSDAFSARLGPLAIDGLMLGGTVALLAIRAATLTPAFDVTDSLDRLENLANQQEAQDWDAAMKEELETVTPVSPAPTATTRTRGARTVSWDARKVVEMILDGAKDPEIKAVTDASLTSIGRLRKVAKMLQADPRAEIDFGQEKVRPEFVSIIRELVSK